MNRPQPDLSLRGGFTLLEMVVVVAIIVMILAAAMPLTGGLRQEKELRDASVEVQHFAREARRLAVQDGETIDLMFTASTLTFNRPGRIPEEEATETLKRGSIRSRGPSFNLKRQTEEELKAAAEAEPPPDPSPYNLGEGLEFRMYSLEKKGWLSVEEWRWRFQPSGLCDPLEVRVYRGDAWLGTRFAPLTAGVVEETFYFP